MSKALKTILGIIGLAAILIVAYIAYTALSAKYDADEDLSGASDNSRMKAVDFVSMDKDGNTVNLSDFFGKPIVLNFWASWCSPCKDEFPDFQNVYDETQDDIRFVMVNLTDGQRETVSKAKSFISENGYTLPVYFDINSDAAYKYSISSIPTTLFIDKEGYVVTGYQGMISEAMLRQGIDKIK